MFATNMDALDPSHLHFLIPESQISQVALSFSAFLTAIFVFVYTTTWLSFVAQRRSQEHVKLPPTVPYMIPFVGSAIGFALNPARHIFSTRLVSSPTLSM